MFGIILSEERFGRVEITQFSIICTAQCIEHIDIENPIYKHTIGNISIRIM